MRNPQEPADNPIDTDEGGNRIDHEVAERLREAVAQAGGAPAVALRASISPRSLSYYLKGREMKRYALVKLAAACGVSVQWLATGEDFMLPGEPAKATVTQEGTGNSVTLGFHRVLPPPDNVIASAADPDLFKTVDVLRLGRAIDYIRQRGGSTLPGVEFARAILIAYDLMSSAEE